MAVTIEATRSEKTPAFRKFVEDVRSAVQGGLDDHAVGTMVADLLRPLLGREDFLALAELAPTTCDYCQHVLHVEEDGSFSVVALVWLPGQSTPIHDHVSWCVVGVHRGEESETVYTLAGENGTLHLLPGGHQVNPGGSVAALIPPGDIHRVANAGQETAVSVHVYGADIRALGSSIRRRYALEVSGAD